MAIYVTSDIHGNYNRYTKLLVQLNLKSNDKLYILGDCIDRGPDGIKILLDMQKRKNIILILGNHEYMMLKYLENNEKYSLWLHENNGGQKTLDEFNNLSKKEQKQVINYIKSSYIQKYIEINNKKFILCHAFYSDKHKDLLYKNADDRLVNFVIWYSPFRDDMLYIPTKFYSKDYTFITGHVPSIFYNLKAPLIKENIVDIDGGCIDESNDLSSLCCIRLDDFLTENPFILNIK